MSRRRPFELSTLEVASGLVLGPGSSAPDLFPRETSTPVAAFEQAILRGLERPPCLVSFSAGRDSSAVLAVAARVARREGLPLPIPATCRFPAVALSGEVEWQELVVAHLGLRDWFRVDIDDEFDCVGPVATGVLRRHGLLWPFNTFFHLPLLEQAKGGSLLTGIRGDEVFGDSRWARARAVLARAERPRPRDALGISLALAPLWLRVRVLQRRAHGQFPWLRADSEHRVLDAIAAEEAAEPFGWAKSFHWWHTLRYWQVGQQSLALLAADTDAQLLHPFASTEFAAALARMPKDMRFGDRSTAMAMLAGDLLPPSVIGRRSKASFDGAFFNAHSRRLVATWNGEGADPEHVDVNALRDHWNGPAPEALSFLLLQAAWLAREHGDSALTELPATRREDHPFGLETPVGSRSIVAPNPATGVA